MTEDRLIELETKLSYQEETLRVLSDALAQQQTRIDKAEQALRQLLDRVATLGDGQNKNTPAEEVPPHY